MVDQRKARRLEYAERERQRMIFKTEAKNAQGDSYDELQMQEDRFQEFLTQYTEKYNEDHPEEEYSIKSIRDEAKIAFKKNAADAEDEVSLYKEAQLKWLGLSQHDREYFEIKSREHQLANRRMQLRSRSSYFQPRLFEEFLDLSKDYRT